MRRSPIFWVSPGFLIARTLYDDLAGREDEVPRKEPDAIIQEYFSGDLGLLYG
jgi:hypothetical protein